MEILWIPFPRRSCTGTGESCAMNSESENTCVHLRWCPNRMHSTLAGRPRWPTNSGVEKGGTFVKAEKCGGARSRSEAPAIAISPYSSRNEGFAYLSITVEHLRVAPSRASAPSPVLFLHSSLPLLVFFLRPSGVRSQEDKEVISNE